MPRARQKTGALSRRDAALLAVLRDRDRWMGPKDIIAAYQNAGWDTDPRRLRLQLQRLCRAGLVERSVGTFRATEPGYEKPVEHERERGAVKAAILDLLSDGVERSPKRVLLDLQRRDFHVTYSTVSVMLGNLRHQKLVEKPRWGVWRKAR